jgi:hypothetical protein
MSTDSSPDRESFQHFLANAFAVQESEMDSESLSAILEVHRLVTRGELGVDGAMHLIVDSARDVANAAGVAIGLLEGDQLIYQAGSGCSSTYIGSRVTASLTASANARTRREILCVENAQTDTRIEAAICRQFGAKSLLILPIYHDRALVGVFEVLFSEAHSFQDREVRTYRLMAGLIEAAMIQASRVEQKENLAVEPPTIPYATDQNAPQREVFLNDDGSTPDPKDKHAIYQRWGAALAAGRKAPVLRRRAVLAMMMVQRAKEVASHKFRWNVALAAVATVFGLTFWIADSDRGPASPLRSSDPPRSTERQQVPFEAMKPTPVEAASGTSKGRAAPSPVKEERPASTRVRRVRAGQNEVDYIGDDVTVRHFTYRPAAQHKRAVENRVAYIGDDVTVRYFTPRPAVRTDSR